MQMVGGAVKRWLNRQVAEIERSRGLRLYGLALTLVHVLTLAFWRGGWALARHVEDPIKICWPLLPGCRAWAGFWESGLWPLVASYAAVTTAGFVAWCAGRTRPGFYLLAVASVLKALLISIDYREMGNYHYMPAVITLLFLASPNKVEVIRFMLVAFYFAAGLLKFNAEWLSGAAIFGQPWLTGRWLVLGCAAVVGLEMIVSLGLLAGSRRIRYAALVAFALFHAFSWHIVGFFYPLVMYALLAIFVLGESERSGSVVDLVRRRCAPATYVTLAIFFGLQVPPFFSRTDSALTGEKRLTALNMFDARIQCFAHVLVERETDGVREIMDINDPVPNIGTRIRCEPWVYEEYARSLRAAAGSDPSFRAVRVKLLAKRTSDADWTLTLDRQIRIRE